MGTHCGFAEMLRMFPGGRVRPAVDAVVPVSQPKKALRRLEKMRRFGKTVLRVD